MHQDNMSAMALIKRGGPASEKSRHIAIRHFWVKERVDAGEAVVRHLPTAQIVVKRLFDRVFGSRHQSNNSTHSHGSLGV